MRKLRTMTLRLEADEYQRLREEARRLGVAPTTLVRMYVRSKLVGDDAQLKRQDGLAALDRLLALTREMPLVDAVQVAGEGRDELNCR